MKCSNCSKEFTQAELEQNNGNCPGCGQPVLDADKQSAQDNAGQAPKKKNKWWIAAIAVAVVAAAGAVFMLMQPEQNMVTSATHENPTALAYITDGAVGLAKGGDTLEFYKNKAQSVNTHAEVAQMFSSSQPYIGSKNYVELENGDRVYISIDFLSMQFTKNNIMLKSADGSEELIDEDAGVIYCNSDSAVYYNKYIDGNLTQHKYKDGQISDMKDIFSDENIIAVKASKDDGLLQVTQLDERQNNIGSGYFYNDKLHMMDEGFYMFGIASNGHQAYVMQTDEATGLVNLHRVKDLETGELELIGEGITEAVIYDDGSLVLLGDVDVSTNAANPAGVVYFYDAQTNTTHNTGAKAVALMESAIRENGWMNENGRDITTSEMSGEFENDKPLYQGQVHYIDENGNFCAQSIAQADGADSVIICEDFYDTENYSFKEDIAFATYAQGCIYWSSGDELFRYKLGSMEKPQVIPLAESVEDKVIEDAAQVGYITNGNGDIVEETQEKMVLKKFSDESSVTILENVGKLTLVGLDNDGKNIFFISEDRSLYSKSVENRSNPKLIATDVEQAQATSEGLYYVVEVEKEEDITIGESSMEELLQTSDSDYLYNLMFRPYGAKESHLIDDDVKTVSATYIYK